VADLIALVGRAREVAVRAYAPYSHFRVGAALEDASGGIHLGCNVEAASYGLSICAERAAIFSAVSAGAARPFSALAVTCLDGGCSPCGACRQVIAEHFAADAPIAVDGLGEFTPSELLPHAFNLEEGA
jgi:cytidine deaminase